MTTGATGRAARPITEGFFTWPSDEPRLIGSRCKTCGTYQFPSSSFCANPNCKNGVVEEAQLSRQGRLFTYTFIFYPPPPPFRYKDPFEPYAIGLVEFPEGVKVAGIMIGCKLEDLRIGMDVETVAAVQYNDEQGVDRLTWKFRAI